MSGGAASRLLKFVSPLNRVIVNLLDCGLVFLQHSVCKLDRRSEFVRRKLLKGRATGNATVPLLLKQIIRDNASEAVIPTDRLLRGGCCLQLPVYLLGVSDSQLG